MRANEFTPGNRDLIIFDIDDTLLHTTAKIKVLNAQGQVIRDLTNQEFNNYQLQPGEKFDFGEFRDAEKFRQESKPIVPMIRKLKTILNHAGNAKVIMLTARADFDNKEEFLQTFKDLGINMSRVHVHRAGNLPGDESPAYKKAVWVRKYLDTKQYGHVRLYDDSMSNLRVFKELQKEYPQVDFRAIYVGPGGVTQNIEEAKRRKKKTKYRFGAYGPGPYGWYGYDSGYSGDGGGGDGGGESIEEGDLIPWPKGTVKIDVSDVYDWYKLGQHISDLDGLGKHDFGKGPPQTVMAFGSEPLEHEYLKYLKDLGLTTHDIDENFADGRNPQDKGDAKRHGINTKASISSLRKTAKQGGRKGQLAHWIANMKAGRAKKK